MKTIQQLLELYKNPFYRFTESEQKMLNDFLLERRASELKKLQKKTSKESLAKTNVIVRNIVNKTNTYAPEADTIAQDA